MALPRVPFATLLLIALAVSADAFAVAVGKGLQMRRFDLRSATAIAVSFGAFQAVMPLLGWLVGTQLERVIEDATTGSGSGCWPRSAAG